MQKTKYLGVIIEGNGWLGSVSYGVGDMDYLVRWHRIADGNSQHSVRYSEEMLDEMTGDSGAYYVVGRDTRVKVPRKVYIIGSLRNPDVSAFANYLRDELPGVEVFDDWMAAGPEADDYWRDYEKAKGNSLEEALKGYAAQHVFNYDKGHLDTSDVVILMLPAGKSGHLELGYSIGKGKKSAILLDAQPDRFDVMYAFADKVTADKQALVQWLKEVL